MNAYLHGLGIINAMGSGAEVVRENLMAGVSPGIQPYADLFTGRKAVVGKVLDPLAVIPQKLQHHDCRNNQLIATAYAQIQDEVETLKAQYGAHRIGVILGTSTSGILASELGFKHAKTTGSLPPEFDYRQQEIGRCSEFLSEYAGITGPAWVISTACSSSGKAFASAARLLETDLCDAVIVGGSDSLCELTLNGFDSLNLLSPKTCSPFSKNRDGINIGEGAALFVLSKTPSNIQLMGVGENSDAHHMSAPDPTGAGAALAMQAALDEAGLTPKDIGYLNCHGTGTMHNDAMESAAIHSIFNNTVACSSTKSLTGHTLGAAGAQDIALCYLLLSQDTLPAQTSDYIPDETLAPITLLTHTQPLEKHCLMSNSFGFGGNNVSVIIGSPA